MSTITREQLRERAREKVKSLEFAVTQTAFANTRAALEEELELARIALASLEAEAVGEVVLGEYDDCGCYPDARVVCIAADGQADWQNFRDGTRLYNAPPAPVSVPEPIKRNDEDGWWMYKGRRVGGGCAEWYNRALDDCRAAMLQGAEPDFREISNSSTNNCREIAETSTKCWCRTCRPVTFDDSRFVVCPECGNKRCPHANDHQNACTGSNDPGQEGSAYPAAPQQEVK